MIKSVIQRIFLLLNIKINLIFPVDKQIFRAVLFAVFERFGIVAKYAFHGAVTVVKAVFNCRAYFFISSK